MRTPTTSRSAFTVAQPADTTPPVRSNGAPSGTLAAGTTQTTLSLSTDENATCRYATTAGVAYGSMPNTFTTTGGTAHATTVTGLVNGGSYSYYVRCQDTAGNANINDFAIAFTVAQPADTTPPVRSNGAPSGTLAAGTTQATLSLGSDENATCRYATTAGVAYGSMPNTFTTTGGTAHATTVTGSSTAAATAITSVARTRPAIRTPMTSRLRSRWQVRAATSPGRESAFGRRGLGQAGVVVRAAQEQWGLCG